MKRFDPGLSPTQLRIVELVAHGMNYSEIATLTGSNMRLVRHHACAAAEKIHPDSSFPTRERLLRWWGGATKSQLKGTGARGSSLGRAAAIARWETRKAQIKRGAK